MTIALIGPGAIGATVAAHLSAGHPDLLICARTPFDRLRVETASGRIEARPALITDPAMAQSVDWVIVATKAYDVEATTAWFPRLIGPDTRVAVLQNGVEHRARFEPHIAAARLVPAVVEIPCERHAPGRVTERRPGWIKVPDDEAGRAFCELFDGPAIEVATVADWTSVAWRKLAVNCAGAVSALTGKPAEIVLRPDVAELMRGLVAEALAVGRAEGADLPDDLPEVVVAQYLRSPAGAVNSLLADRLAGRPMEWDARNGVIARLGARHGLATPLNAMAATVLAATG